MAPVGDRPGRCAPSTATTCMQVTERGLASFEEVREDIKAELSAPSRSTSLGIWRQVRLAKAAVTVDPRFGVWDGLTGQVLPRGTSTQG